MSTTITLARKRIPVVRACGAVESFDLHGVQWLHSAGLVAKLVRRASDGKVIRVLLLAVPGEIARRSSQSTVAHVLPLTHTHRSSLALGM